MKRLARKMMNQAAKNRVISKQEACCQLAGLKLLICSERFETISISGQYKIGTESAAKTTILGRYAIRKNHMDLSLHEYFKKLKSTSKIKIVPHYVGGRINAVYPPSANYAKSVLIVHFPWNTKFPYGQLNSKQLLRTFKSFITSPTCPKTVTIPYSRAKQKYTEKKKNCGTHYKRF